MTKSNWQIFFTVLSLIFCIKGLGGSFNQLFANWGLDFYHGPVIGALMGLSLSGYFLNFSETPGQKSPLSSKEKGLTCILFFIPLILAMWLRITMIQNTPLDINRADMLFAIKGEISTVLMGHNPYGPVLMSDGREVLHGYPPMLWLSYLPLYVLNWDLRYLNVFAQFIFYLFLLDLFLRKQTYWFKNAYFNIAVFLTVFLMHLFSKQATRQPVDVHTGPYWLYWTIFLWLVSRDKLRQSFWFISLILLCREPAIILLLPLAVVIFLNQRKLFIEAFWKSLLVGLFIAGPFILWAPDLYFKGIRFYSHHIYENPIEVMVRYYGLSGILKLTNTLWLQKFLQCFGVFLSFLVIYSRSKTISVAQALALGGLSYMWLMLFASLSYPFIYTEVIMLFYALFLWPTSQRSTTSSLSSVIPIS